MLFDYALMKLVFFSGTVLRHKITRQSKSAFDDYVPNSSCPHKSAFKPRNWPWLRTWSHVQTGNIITQSGSTKKFRFIVCYRLGSGQNPNNDTIRFKPENLSALILSFVVHSQRAMPQPPCTTNRSSTVFALVALFLMNAQHSDRFYLTFPGLCRN